MIFQRSARSLMVIIAILLLSSAILASGQINSESRSAVCAPVKFPNEYAFLDTWDIAYQLTGRQAPDFSLPDLDSNMVSLHDYRGNNVILFFWDSLNLDQDNIGLTDCLKQMVDFANSCPEDSHVRLLPIHYKFSVAAARKHLTDQHVRKCDWKYSVPLLFDSERHVADAYYVPFPTTFIIDTSGRIAFVDIGIIPYVKSRLSAAIAAAQSGGSATFSTAGLPPEWFAEQRKQLPRIITLPSAKTKIIVPRYHDGFGLHRAIKKAASVAQAIDDFWRKKLRAPTETEVPLRGVRVRFMPTHHSLFADVLDSDSRVRVTIYTGGTASGIRRYDEPRPEAFASAEEEMLASDPPDTNAIGNLIADAMRTASDADFALHNMLGHRGDIPVGPINDTIVNWVIPFTNNRMVVVDLTGEALARAIGFAEAGGRPWFISGGRALLRQPEQHEKWANAAIFDSHDNPIDPEKTYRVVVSDYCFALSSYYGPIDGKIIEVGDTIRNALRHHIASIKNVRPDRNPRITRPQGTTRANPFNR